MTSSNALHIITGAAGVGKSTFGSTLAGHLGAALLDSDTVSESVVIAGMQAAGLDPTDRDSDHYKRIFRDPVYQCLFATAVENLPNVPVIIVGPFTRELQDPTWPQQLKKRFTALPTIWFLTCPEPLRRQRIISRNNPRDGLKIETWKHAPSQPPTPPAFKAHTINTAIETPLKTILRQHPPKSH